MSLNITPTVAEGQQLVQGYGEGRFRIADVHHEGSVLVFATETLAWPVTEVDAITMETLAPVLAKAGTLDLLVVGSGPVFTRPPEALQAALKEVGIALEWMDTGAACRTYNVLLTEDRRAAAALIAVD